MNKEILRLSIPNIISNLTIPLVGIVDIGLMGHLNEASYLGAIALGSSVFTFIYAGLGFIRMGTSGFTAQSFGERNIEKSFLILARSFSVAFIFAFLLILLQEGISWLAFYFLESSEIVKLHTLEYFKIRIWAAPASLSLFAIMGWYIGMQNSKIPMFLAILINVSNIIFSTIFVRYYDMAIQGVALGTVISQYIGFAVGLILLSRHSKRMRRYWHFKNVFKKSEMLRFMNVNKDILIRSLLLTGSFYYFNTKSADLGDNILAVNSLLLQFLWIFSYFIDGFAFAAEALTGKYIGASSKVKLQKMVKLLLVWGGGLSIITSIVYYLLYQNIIMLLTEQTNVIELSGNYKFWVILLPFISFSAFVWDGIFIGATQGRAIRNAMIFSFTCIFIPSIFIFENLWANHGLWLSLSLFMLSRGLSLSLLFKRSILQTV